MKPFSRTAMIASALSIVLEKLGVGPWNNFMITAILFVGVVRITGVFPGNFPSLTTCIAVGISILLVRAGVGALYAFIIGGLAAFPVLIYLLYRYLASDEEFPAE